MNKLAILLFVVALMGPAYAANQPVSRSAAPAAQPGMIAQDNAKMVPDPKTQGFPPTYQRNGDLNPDGYSSL
jgi:hypothetical protein